MIETAWLESHQSLRDHPKTRKLARRLGVRLPEAVGILHCLWWWCMDYAPDGNLTEIEDDVIADACAWDGDPGELIDALVTATARKGGRGFLDNESGLKVHDWKDYAGMLLAKREKDRKRKAEGRRVPVQRTSSGHPSDGARTYLPTYQPKQVAPVDNSKTYCPHDGATLAADGHCPVCDYAVGAA